MENDLDKHMDDIMSQHGVIGVLCSDQQGLALSAKGTANPMYSGLVCSLVENAKKLYPDKDLHPVICLESDACFRICQQFVNLLVRSEGSVTVAIHKVPS